MKSDRLFILLLLSMIIVTLISFSSCSTQAHACAAYASTE